MKYLTFALFAFLSWSQVLRSADWESTDIGAVAAAGSASTDDHGGFVVNGSGQDIWNAADEFHYVYLPVEGDAQIVGRVLSLQNTDPWAKAGLMVRETFAANSRNVMVFLTPANQSGFQYRSAVGGASSYIGGPAVSFPYWIKLARVGNTFTAYRSADGASWAAIGSTTVSMAGSVSIGLAVTSHRDGTLAQARYDNVTVTGSTGTTTNTPPPTGTNAPPSGGTNAPPSGATNTVPRAPTNLSASPANSTATSNRIDLTWTDNATNETGYRVERSTNGVNFQALTLLNPNMTSHSDINLPPGTHYWYRVFAVNQAGDSPPSNVADATTTSGSPPPSQGFQGRDIGSVRAPGHYGQNQDLFSIWGSGDDIYGTADEFFFVYASVTGDFQAVGRIREMDNTDPWAKAGFMARETLDANSRNFMVLRNPASTSGVQVRAATGGNTTFTSGGVAPAPQWFKLSRSGNVFSGYRSTNGNSWTLISSTTMSLPNTIYVGMAVTSHAANTNLCNAIFDHVVTPFNGGGGGGTGSAVPTAPRNAQVTLTTSNTATLMWGDSSTNETGFRVERSTNGVNFAAVTNLPANSTEFRDGNLTPSTHYWYRVFAFNDAGDSQPSNVAEATTASDGGAGSSGVPAAPSLASIITYSSYTMSVGWRDNSTNETGFRVERSTNGVNFAAVGSPPPNSTRFDDGNLTPSTHYWYRVFAVNAAGDSPPSNVAEGNTSSFTSATNWPHQDIGAVSAAGSFSQSGDTYTVAGSGADIGGTADEFHFAYQNVTGFYRIIARVDQMANTSPWAKAGVMVRTSADPGAPFVMLALTPEHGLAFQYRGANGAQSSYVDAGPGSAPVWLMLVSGGSSPASPGIDAMKSSDGFNWTKVGSVSMYFADSPVLAGMAVTSANDGALCNAKFSYVTIDGKTVGGGGSTNGTPVAPAAPTGLTATATSSTQINLAWRDNSTNETGFVLERSTNGTSFQQVAVFNANTQTAVEAVNPGTHHWYRVAATNSAGLSPYSNIADATTPTSSTAGPLPAPWQDRDIASSGGSATFSNGVFRVIGSGWDIYDTSDQFHFAYQPASGDQTIIAALDRLDLVSGSSMDPWARIGLMIRETLDANSKNAMVFLSHQHGTGLTWRGATGGTTQYTPGSSSARFVRLTRTGSTFSAYVSSDAVNWQLMGSATINMASSTYIGLAVLSHNNSAKVLGQFSQVTVTP